MSECVEINFLFSRCLPKEASKLSDCGKKWPRSSWHMWRTTGQRKENGHLLGCGRAKLTSNLQFHVGRQLLDHVPLQNSSGTDAVC